MTDELREAAPLLPCPFCGDDGDKGTQAVTLMNAERTSFRRVSCRCCGATCPEPNWNHRAALAQQDAQAVVQEPCAVVKWQTGGPVVHIIGDVQAGDLLYRAAPTPPAQRVMLTDDEIEDLVRGKSGHSDFARAVIEAYKRKKGIK